MGCVAGKSEKKCKETKDKKNESATKATTTNGKTQEREP